MSDVFAHKIHCEAVPDMPTASWTNAWRVGNEVVLSGMTGHPATRDAAAVSGLVFPELRVEIDAWARLDVDLRDALLTGVV